MRTSRQSWAMGLILLLGVVHTGCKKAKADESLSKQVKQGAPLSSIPVPPENGPKLYAVKPGARVVEKPAAGAAQIGELLVGASVSRSEETYGQEGCAKGFYAVRPRGFVCLDDTTSLNPGSPVREPEVERALPYRYGRANATTPIYARIPTPAEQSASEPNLEKHLAKYAKVATDSLKAGANDVPLDDKGTPTGPAVLNKTSQGANADGKRTRESFFTFNEESTPTATDAELTTTVLRKGSTVAVTATFMAAGPDGPRRFGVLPDGTFFPVDRLEPVLGTTWHGVDLTKEIALPIAFVIRNEVCPYKIANAKGTRLVDDEVERRTVVPLSNKWRQIDNIRFEEATDGTFYREKDIVKIVKRSKFPDFVAGDTKWVDVSLAMQTMTMYEGKKAVYATLVSSGEGPIGDPAVSSATMQGTFKVTRKSLHMPVDVKESKEAFDITAAPYGVEFAPGFAFRAAYWSDGYGEAHAFHDVNLAPIDAHKLYDWAGSDIPAGWVWTAASDEITVVVRK